MLGESDSEVEPVREVEEESEEEEELDEEVGTSNEANLGKYKFINTSAGNTGLYIEYISRQYLQALCTQV